MHKNAILTTNTSMIKHVFNLLKNTYFNFIFIIPSSFGGHRVKNFTTILIQQ